MFIRDGTPSGFRTISSGVPSGRNGMSSCGQDAGDDALVAVTAGHLIADGDLPLLGDIDADDLVDTGGQLVAVFAGEDLDIDDDAGFAVRDLQGGIADLAGLFAEDGAQQALLSRQLRLALRGDLADEVIAGGDLRADADDAVFVEILEGVLADVGDITGDLFRPQLRVAGLGLVLFNMNGGEDILAHQALVQEDGVLVVVAFPGHEADQHVLAQCNFALRAGGAVGNDLIRLDPLADRRRWGAG